ncbi:ataxin-7-like protein 1 isoform X1 [Erpetoichthys calabaricus]|uniref:Ataxin 7 like 1 n=3 Tax=Erpetoichthys calabaricus TaxID=27687 RepID=A0A8C4RMM2_ERPCA|nr:ataxin-7-like protein 1 isoform X1 [Erpetoichthys calabaricus]
MATLDRKLPSPDAFLCKPWSTFIDAAKLHCSDNVDLEETGKELGKCREVMRLNREDMHLFGHCPAHDDFYLVLCNFCNQVVKPQVFQSHCERRHSSLCKPSPTPASPSCNSRTSLAQMKPKTYIRHNTVNSSYKPFRTPKDNLHTSINKQQPTGLNSKPVRDKSCVPIPVVSLEKISNLAKAESDSVKMISTALVSSTSSSTTSAAALAKSSASTAAKQVSLSPEKIVNGKGVTSPSLLDRKQQNGTKSCKSYKRLSEREFDPNKHCGVLDPETKKPCTRSLTCKTHSLTYRRAVPGRKKQFDILLAEHKARTKEKEPVKCKEHQGTRELNHNQSIHSQEPITGLAVNYVPENKSTSPAKSKLSNPNHCRTSLTGSFSIIKCSASSGMVQDLILSTVEGDVENHLSSDEGDLDSTEDADKIDCHFSGCHPRPLAICSFGSRLLGRGYYVFDRRWDHLRLALNSMIEKHLNSQMWKKIPPAADSPITSPALHITATYPALQAFSSPNAVYLSSSVVNSSITSSYVMTTPILSSSSSFANTSDINSILSYSTAFSQGTASFSIVKPTAHTGASQSYGKQSRTKTSKTSKVKDISSETVSSSLGNKKKKPQASVSSPLCTSSVLPYSRSHKKNYVLNPRSLINTSQTNSSFHGVSVHESKNGTNSLSAKSEPSGWTALSGNLIDSSKHVSTVVNSIDSTLSVAPQTCHSGEYALTAHKALPSGPIPFDKSDGKKRKNSSPNYKSSKITKMPGMNNVHRKNTANHLSVVTESPNSSLLRQPKVHY